jgi:hypothetical protein
LHYPIARHSARTALARPAALGILLAALGCLVWGCASPGGGQEPWLVPVEPRVDVVAGSTLVMPVRLAGSPPARSPELVVGDGRRLGARLHWIGVEPGSDGGVSSRWLEPPGRWGAVPAARGMRPSGAGAWVVVADIPADAAGDRLSLGGQRINAAWIDPFEGPEAAWASPVAEPVRSLTYLQWLLEPEALSPVRRWRHRLVFGELGDGEGPPAGSEGGRSGVAAGTFADPVIEALAIQTQRRWMAGLATLHGENPELARRLRERLTRLVDFGSAHAPAWPQAGPDMDALLLDLLNPHLTAERRADRVQSWLGELPQGVAWIVDDAGVRDAGRGRDLATIGVANLDAAAVLAWAEVPGHSGPSDIHRLDPGGFAQLIARGPAPGGEEHEGGWMSGLVEVRVGREEYMLDVAAGATPVSPPGLRIGPLLLDWSLPLWLGGGAPAGVAVPISSPGGTGALLHRVRLSDPARPEAPQGPRWALYVQCAGVEGEGDHVRVWLGPYGTPSAVLRIGPDGRVRDDVVRGGRPERTWRVEVAREADRWSCQVLIPPEAIEPDGTLRIGIQRVDGSGRRSAWPRPMLPWQVEPARLAVDTGAWGSIGER